MQCPACAQPIEEGADLCLSCGEPMSNRLVAHGTGAPPTAKSPAPTGRRIRRDDEESVRCPNCGVPSSRDRPRCRSCGAPLKAAE